MKKGIISFLIGLVGLVACSTKTNFGPQTDSFPQPAVDSLKQGILVLNEGNFGLSNASLSVINSTDDKISNQLFKSINNKDLGDVAQSCVIHDSLVFLLINNSNRVKVLNRHTWELLYDLDLNASPRYGKVYNNQLLITTMGNNGVKSISLTDFSVSSWANTSGWLEEFVITKSKLLACNRTDHTLDIYDVQTGVKEGKINLVKDPESLVAVDDNIYVLSTGGWSTNEQELAAIQKINLNDFSVRVEYKFSNINHSPTRLRLDTNASKLFYINNAVFEYNLLSKEEPKQLFKRSNDILYGLAIHPISGSIYTTGANNYVEQGSVYCLNPDGTLKKEYQAGIIPSFMAFF